MTYTELLQAAARGEKVNRAEFIKCIEEAGFSNDNGKLLCYWKNGEPREGNGSWTMDDEYAYYDVSSSSPYPDLTVKLDG